MKWWTPTERQKWASPLALSRTQSHLGLASLDDRSQELYGTTLPRGVTAPRFTPDRPPLNHWMSPEDLARYAYLPGQIILGKFANQFLGHLDDRPMVTVAGARAGKTSTILEPNLYLYPGSMLVLDPKGELARTARFRRMLGHDVYVLDPFGQSGEPSACFNALAELNPDSWTIVDDVATITHALIIEDGDAKSKHWNDSARALLMGIILLALTLDESQHNLTTVRQILSLTHPQLLKAIKQSDRPVRGRPRDRNSIRRIASPLRRSCQPWRIVAIGSAASWPRSVIASRVRRRMSAAVSSRRRRPRPTFSTACRYERFLVIPTSGSMPCAVTGRPRSSSAYRSAA
jgi:hypothetical protein